MFKKNFLNDGDGLSAKDYMMLISSIVFFLFVAIGLVVLLCGGQLDPTYIELLQSVSPVLMTITGGVMGVQAVESFVDGKIKVSESENSNNNFIKDSEYVPSVQPVFEEPEVAEEDFERRI